jgi:uncharacterized delta-60 repeat protein
VQSDFAVVRLDSTGQNDNTFNGNGTQIIPFNLGGDNDDVASSIALGPDGKIVVAGTAKVFDPPPGSTADTINRAAIAQLLPNGALDNAFGGSGKVTIPLVQQGITLSTTGDDVAALGDGSILVGGTAQSNTFSVFLGVLAKLTAGGVLDTGFGTGGIALLPTFGVNSLAALPDGKVLVSSFSQIYRTTAPPPVVVETSATTQGRPNARVRRVRSVSLRFNTPLNPVLAGNKLAYTVRLRRRAIPIRRADYDAATNTVSITFRQAVQTNRPLLVRIAGAGIVDLGGQVLNNGNPFDVEIPLPATTTARRVRSR